MARATPFGGCVSVIEDEPGVWHVEVNVPYFPSLLKAGRDYYSKQEASFAAFHLEAKLNRMVHAWNNRKLRPRKEPRP